MTTSPMTTGTLTADVLGRPTAAHTAELLVAAVGLQYGLARLLAHAVEAATRAEDRDATHRSVV